MVFLFIIVIAIPKGLFRLLQFCCDQGLAQFVANNWKFFVTHCSSRWSQQNCSSLNRPENVGWMMKETKSLIYGHVKYTTNRNN